MRVIAAEYLIEAEEVAFRIATMQWLLERLNWRLL